MPAHVVCLQEAASDEAAAAKQRMVNTEKQKIRSAWVGPVVVWCMSLLRSTCCRDIVRAAFAPLRVGLGRDCSGVWIATCMCWLGRPGLTRQVDASIGPLAHNAEQLPVQLGRPCLTCACQPPWQSKLENVIGRASLQAASLNLRAFLPVLLG